MDERRSTKGEAASTGTIRVEVAYGEPRQQALVNVDLPPGATLADAIEASDLRTRFPGLEVDPDRVGIFGRKAQLTQLLREGDRVEIYRPLIADPKEVRRARAEAQTKA